MGLEIERKFLVDHEKWQQFDKPEGINYQQGYLVNEKGKTVRIRIAGNKAFITIKGATENFTRKEFEYEIPLEDAQELFSNFDLKGISKTRYCINFEGKIWEIDVFSGENEGLIVAEIELKNESETFSKPAFIAAEVSEDARYYNSNLIENSYKSWENSSK